MTGKDKLPVLPSRGTQIAIENRLLSAKRGHALLKRKADALQMRFRSIHCGIVEKKGLMADIMKEAAIALARAKFETHAKFNETVIENISNAEIQLRQVKENIGGVSILEYDAINVGEDAYKMVGLSTNGHHLNVVKTLYQEAIKITIKLASLETSHKILGHVLKQTNQRVNVLEHVLVPKLKLTLDYIKSEMDEMEREEFYRLKKIQGKKGAAAEKKKMDMMLKDIAERNNLQNEE